MGIYTDNAGLIQIARWPFAVMLLDYIFALPGFWTAEYLYVILLGVQSFVYLRRTFRCSISSCVNGPGD